MRDINVLFVIGMIARHMYNCTEHETLRKNMITSTDIQKLAEKIEGLQQEVLATEYKTPEAVKTSPLFSAIMAAKFCGISRRTFNNLMKEHDLPHSPQFKVDPETGKERSLPPKFSMSDIEAIRKILKANGQKGNHSKRRPDYLDKPFVINVGNLKGGVGKTQVTIHLIQFLSGMGYPCLAIDSDPQASLSSMAGFLPYPYHNAPEDAYVVRTENTLLSLYRDNMPLVPVKTYWENFDLIPANIEGYSAEYYLPARPSGYNDNFYDVLDRAISTNPEDWEQSFKEYYEQEPDELEELNLFREKFSGWRKNKLYEQPIKMKLR